MKKTSLKAFFILLLSVALLGTGCSKIINQKSEAACSFVQNRNSQRVSWKSDLPLKFRVHKDMPKAAYASLLRAAAQWNLISTKNVIQIIRWDATGFTISSPYSQV